MLPIDFREVSDPELPRNPALSTLHNVYLGVEDVRIYLSHTDEIRFIGTTLEYADGPCLRMVEGVLDTESSHFSDARIVEPPTWTYCEKNWAPVSDPLTKIDDRFPGVKRRETPHFVYKWSPMQIGRVPVCDQEGANTFEIVRTHDIIDPLFRRLKGSTSFVSSNESGWVGVVHFSIEGSPRQYYHMLLLLDRDTLRPLKYSTPFLFDRIGIEFCIGFTITNQNMYHFWISRVDRDPMHICLPVESIPFLWEVV
jgi:hypothetical protein